MVENCSIILQQDQLDVVEDLFKYAEDNFHIYIIGRRPRILFGDNISFTEKTIQGNILIQSNKSFVDYAPFSIEFKDKSILYVSLVTNDQYIQIDFTNNSHAKIHAASVYSKSSLHNLEVLYIGRAYGDSGSRTVFQRLKSHSKLQKIYADHQGSSDDIWITIWRFSPNGIIYMPAFSSDETLSNFVKDLSDFHRYGKSYINLSSKQDINVTEAALIRYFKPKYNEKLKNLFPVKSHSEYSECYDLKLDFICVELDTTNSLFSLWSPEQPSISDIHNINFTFNSEEKFEDLFI